MPDPVWSSPLNRVYTTATMVTVDSNLPGRGSAYTYEFEYKPNGSEGWRAPGSSTAVVLYWGTEHWNNQPSNQVTFLMWGDGEYMNAGHGTDGNPVWGTNTQYIRARLRSADIGCRVVPPGWTAEECVALNPWDVTYTGPGYDLSRNWQTSGFSNPNSHFHHIRVTREASDSSTNPDVLTVYVDGHMVAQRRQAPPNNMPQCGGSTSSSSGGAVTGWADACRKLYLLGRPVNGVMTEEQGRSTTFGAIRNIKIWSSVV